MYNSATTNFGSVAELAYAHGLGPCPARGGGSTPLRPTKFMRSLSEIPVLKEAPVSVEETRASLAKNASFYRNSIEPDESVSDLSPEINHLTVREVTKLALIIEKKRLMIKQEWEV